MSELVRKLEVARAAVAHFPPAAMFELRDRGFGALWQQLASCVLSIRTRDEVSLPASVAMLTRFPTPESLAEAPDAELLEPIRSVTFAESKLRTLRAIGAAAVAAGGDLPTDRDTLLALPGIGPKCANLALGVARGVPAVSVDIHVHRVVNRWGEVQTATPEATMLALDTLLPTEWKVEINAVLVPFGKHICAARPKCPVCPLRDSCPKIGVRQVAA